MPAGLPGDSLFNNQGNPNAGDFVTFDALSGPKDSPFDAKSIDYTTGTPPGWDETDHVPILTNDDSNVSTGALSTGIGFGSPPVIASVGGNFSDAYVPGVTLPDGNPSDDSTIMYIGGGKSDETGAPEPYTEGFGIAAAGNGGSRDSGANTGFGMQLVTASGDVANGAVVETGYVNRSGVAIEAGQSVFGSASTAFDPPA